MADDQDPSSVLLQFFQEVLAIKSRDPQPGRAEQIAGAVASAEGGWALAIREVVEWLKSDPSLWFRAAEAAIANFGTGEASSRPTPSVGALLMSNLLRDSEDPSPFVATLDEAKLNKIGALVPDLVLETDVARVLLARCATVRGGGQCPALCDELTSWSIKNIDQAESIIESRLSARDRDEAMPLWALEPLIEGFMRHDARPIDQRLAWRDATIDRLFETASPRRRSLAAYIACVAWPTRDWPIADRHAALVRTVRRAPADLIPSALDALVRDVWTSQNAVFETLLALAELIAEAETAPALALDFLRSIAVIAARGLATLNGKPLPDTTETLLASLRMIPPSRGDHSLDHVLSAVWPGARAAVEAFLIDYVRIHAGAFLRTGASFDETFPSLGYAAGAGVVGAWLVSWIVDQYEPLRSCASYWVGTGNEIGLSAAAIASLSLPLVRALIHMLLAAPLPGEAVFKALSLIGEERRDAYDEVKAAFIDELLIDYPGLARRWVELTEQSGAKLDSSLRDLAAIMRAHLEENDRAWNVRRQTPELYASSPCYSAWMELHQEANAQIQRDAMKRSFFAGLVNTVHIARGESTTHSLNTKATPLVLQQFSNEQRVRTLLDPVGSEIIRVAHLRAAGSLITGVSPG